MNSTDYQVSQLKERVRELEHRVYEDVQELREYIDEKVKRRALNQKQINQLIKDAGYGDEQNEKISDFINGIAFAEAAHGIKE